jgi:hypothetical protein
MATMNYGGVAAAPGHKGDKIAKELAKIVSSCMGEECRVRYEHDYMCMRGRLILELKRSGLGQSVMLDAIDMIPVDIMADQAINKFRRMLDDDARKRGYPVKEKQQMAMAAAYPWSSSVAGISINAESATTKILNQQKIMLQEQMMQASTNAAFPQFIINPDKMINTVYGEPVKKTPEDYRAKLQREVDDWLH